MTAETRLKQALDALRSEGLYRSRQAGFNSNQDLLNFSSNDYLSLSKDKNLAAAYQKGYATYPLGSGGSMLLGGYHPIHRRLELAFAEFLGVEEALLVSSGYVANLCVSALLKQLQVHCLIDKGLHASFYDGLKMHDVPFSRYLHQDMNDFYVKNKKCPENSMVITEGIFSMSGQITDLAAFASHRPMIVDEAHAFGILGENGRGATDRFKLNNQQIPLRVVPLGKAFAAQGAVIAGSHQWITGLVQFGRAYIYSTGLSPALAYGMLKTLDIVAQANERRKKLNELIAVFRHHVLQSDLNWADSTSPIQQLKLGCAHQAERFFQQLKKQGILCLPVRTPTVPKPETGLRIILNYCHQPEDIFQLFTALKKINHDHILQ